MMDNKIICDEKNETNKISRLNRKGRVGRVGRVGGIKQDSVIKDIENTKFYGSDFDLDELSIFLPKNELHTQLDDVYMNKQTFKLLESCISTNVEYQVNSQNNDAYKKRNVIPFISSFEKLENDNNNSLVNDTMEYID